MIFLIQGIIARMKTPHPKIQISKSLWQKLCADLKSSSVGRRESGAFLLGHDSKIESYVLYEDLDQNCLFQGAIRLQGKHYGQIWKICRERSQKVIADVHTHPGREFQSSIDRANPIMAKKRHVGLIIPFYAARNPTPSKTGIYQYLGHRQWRTISPKKRHEALILTGE